MRDLTPVGPTEDGSRLLLVGSSGEEFSVPLDALRAALSDQNARPGPLETKMESTLRPRDIQSRIRAGESAEEVATAARTTPEAIMAFAAPVLAERAHVAQTALRASVRRRTGETVTAARTLGEAAEIFLAGHGLHDEDVEWDAWRRPDGRWALVASYAVDGEQCAAEFTHDLPGRYVVAENDEARLLTGELQSPGRTAARGASDPGRRLSSVPSQDQLPLGDDAIELVRDRVAEPDDDLDELPAPSGPEATPEVSEPAAQSPEEGAEEEEHQPTLDGGTAPEPAPRKKGRSSVPSWDEIMFGGGKGE